MPLRYHQVMGLIRKAVFLAGAATGTPVNRWNSSAEAAAKQQSKLLKEQNEILSRIANGGGGDSSSGPSSSPASSRTSTSAWSSEPAAMLHSVSPTRHSVHQHDADSAASAVVSALANLIGSSDAIGLASASPQAVQKSEPTLTDKLTEIKVLLDTGIITADEHAAMRKKVLGI